VVLAGFCSFLDLYSTQPILPLLVRELPTSPAAASLTVTIATAGVAIAAPFMGALAGRLGDKRTIVSCAWLLALFTVLAGLSRSLGDLLAWRFLQGIVTPGIFAVTIAYIQQRWLARGAGAATAAYVTGTVLGGFSGRAISGWTAGVAGWRSSFFALALLTAAGAALLTGWLPRQPATGRAMGASSQRWVYLLRNRPLRATWAVGFCVLFSMQAVFTYIPFHLSAPPFRLGPDALGSIFAVFLIGAVITPWFGKRIDRYGHRPVLAIAMGISGAGALLTLAPSLAAIIAGLSLICTGVFIAQAAASSHIGLAEKQHISVAVGIYVTCYYIGGSAGAAVPGWFWGMAGWKGCVLLVASVQASTVAIAWKGWQPEERDLNPGGGAR